MKMKQIAPIISLIFILLVVTAACSPQATPEPTATAIPPTDTPAPTATKTKIPTSTPTPTATPNLAATQEAEEVAARIQSYVDKGYLTSTEGELIKLDDYEREMAKIGYLDFDFAGTEDLVQNFAIWANIKWENAGPVGPPYYSGCGFNFRMDPDNFDGYTAMLTNSRVLLTYCDSSISRCGEIGKTRGSGKLSLGNPAEASMEMVVNGTQAYVLVDGEFIGEYTLFKDKLIDPGYLVYSIISGTNRDYGLRCEITESNLWVVK
ncbi:MAG: hypothetical protein AB1649_30540 [Chloroflexota bacterium]